MDNNPINFNHTIANAVDYNEISRKILDRVPLYYSKEGLWYKYNDEEYRWETEDEIAILNAIDEEMRIANICRSDIRTQLLQGLKMESRKKSPIEIDKEQIQFKDKIINFRTGKEVNATREYFTFNPIPYKIGDSEDTPIIDKFMKEWVGKEHYLKLQEWIAYHLLRDYPIHRIACLNGGGSNGKTTCIDFITNLLGEKNIIGGDFESIFLERFGTSLIYRKMGLKIGETNYGTLTKTSKFKSMTGGDAVIIEFKGKGGFDYKNYAKVTMSTNSLPVTEDKTNGFYRRWLIIDFPNEFTEKYDLLSKITEKEYENFCKKCLRLLKELIKRGNFTNEGSIEERRIRYEKISNPVQTFIEDFTEKGDEKNYISKSEFLERINIWMRNKRLRTLKNGVINKIMEEEYCEGYRTNSSMKQERSWLRIKWKEDEKC